MGRRSRKRVRKSKQRSRVARPKLRKKVAAGDDLREQLNRCTRELDDALRQQIATSEVLSIIRQSPTNAQPVFEAIVQSASHLCGAIFGVLYLCDEDRLRIVATNNFTPSAATHLNQLQEQKRPERSHLGGRAVLDRKIVHVPDVFDDPEYSHELARAGGWRAVVAVPLLRDGIALGALTAAKAEPGPFSDRQLQLLKTFADQAVIAIENTRLLNELRESLQQQTATADVLKVISRSTFDLQTVLDTLTESAAQLCDAELANVWRPHGSVYRLAASHRSIGAKQKRYLDNISLEPSRGSCVGRTLLDGKTVHIHDIQDDPEYALETSKLEGWRTMLGVPLLREGVPIGVIALVRSTRRPFTDKQIELATTFADQAVIAIENVRLFDEVQARTRELSESLQQQTATADVLRVISRSAFDLKVVLRTLVESAAQLCEAQQAIVTQSDDNGLYQLAASFGNPEEFEEYMKQNPLAPSRATTTGRVALEGKIVHIPDVLADPDYVFPKGQQLGGYRSNLGVPLLRDGVPIGAFVLMRPVVKPFTDKQIELVESFAAQAVIAIENARLLNELRQRTDDLSESLEQQTATSEVLRVISSSAGELEPVFQTLLGNATRLCMADFGFMFQYKDGFFQLMAQRGADPAYVEYMQREPLRPGPETLLGRIAKSISPVQIADFASSQAYLDRDPLAVVAVERAGVRTLFGVPMLREGELIGAIAVYRQEVTLFTEKQIDLLTNFAAQAVIAIENTRLLNELRESLQQQTATADVLKVISRSTFDLQTVLQTLVESAARLCDAEKATITREKNGAFYRAESYGFSSEYMDYIKDVPIEPDRSSISGRSLVEGRAVHVADVTNDPEHKLAEAQRLGDYRTALAVPMLREGVAIGVLSLVRNEVRPFSDKQIDLVTTFADQAAIAIENVRLFDEVQARTRELAKSLDDLRTTQDRLVQTQKLATLGQLTAGIAHEMKNPLNFVNNFSVVSSELIDELQESLNDVSLNAAKRDEVGELMDTLRGNLDKVVQHGKRADAIVKNMLQHSRESSGEHRPVDINALVEESVNLAWHGARAEKQGFEITLKHFFDPSAGEIDIFPQDIRRALLNLISNGFYAATKRRDETNGGDYEPILTASTKNLGDRVEITIRDNGTGITQDVKDKMFNPFFTTKPTGEGTGLGLSISHDIIVKQHAGLIEVDTQPGEFTEIRIILPRAAVPL
jgi:GAF domain-containing protein